MSKAVEHNWPRNILVMQIETQARERERSGKAVTNFVTLLPKPQPDLARESLKDPYRFDFLGLTDEAEEREIESALVQHISRFLVELGASLAFVGRQVHIEVGGDDFLLTCFSISLKLHCYVVVELKAGAPAAACSGQTASCTCLHFNPARAILNRICNAQGENDENDNQVFHHPAVTRD